jgi:hypothetical protein
MVLRTAGAMSWASWTYVWCNIMKYLRVPIAFKMAGKLYAHNCLLSPNMPNILNVTHLPYISLSHTQTLPKSWACYGLEWIH